MSTNFDESQFFRRSETTAKAHRWSWVGGVRCKSERLGRSGVWFSLKAEHSGQVGRLSPRLRLWARRGSEGAWSSAANDGWPLPKKKWSQARAEQAWFLRHRYTLLVLCFLGLPRYSCELRFEWKVKMCAILTGWIYLAAFWVNIYSLKLILFSERCSVWFASPLAIGLNSVSLYLLELSLL